MNPVSGGDVGLDAGDAGSGRGCWDESGLGRQGACPGAGDAHVARRRAEGVGEGIGAPDARGFDFGVDFLSPGCGDCGAEFGTAETVGRRVFVQSHVLCFLPFGRGGDGGCGIPSCAQPARHCGEEAHVLFFVPFV